MVAHVATFLTRPQLSMLLLILLVWPTAHASGEGDQVVVTHTADAPSEGDQVEVISTHAPRERNQDFREVLKSPNTVAHSVTLLNR